MINDLLLPIKCLPIPILKTISVAVILKKSCQPYSFLKKSLLVALNTFIYNAPVAGFINHKKSRKISMIEK